MMIDRCLLVRLFPICGSDANTIYNNSLHFVIETIDIACFIR
jgi:hypothetical protein